MRYREPLKFEVLKPDNRKLHVWLFTIAAVLFGWGIGETLWGNVWNWPIWEWLHG